MKWIALLIFMAGMYTASQLNHSLQDRKAQAATNALIRAKALLKNNQVNAAKAEVEYAISVLEPASK